MLLHVLIALVGFERHFNPDLSHIRFFTRGTLDRCLRRAGFVSTSWLGVGRIWPVAKSVFVTARKQGPPEAPPTALG